MSDLEVTYSEHITEPILKGSELTVPSRYGRGWEDTGTGHSNVHIAVQFDRAVNTLPDGSATFLSWIFYAQTDGTWAETEWSDLTEECKAAVFDEVVAKPRWVPFYEQDVLPPWEDSWLTLAALGQA